MTKSYSAMFLSYIDLQYELCKIVLPLHFYFKVFAAPDISYSLLHMDFTAQCLALPVHCGNVASSSSKEQEPRRYRIPMN